ncbi:alpha/beta hydrolase-fold protein [Flavobacterium sp.]|uniref:alpha/beta hydrolase n=1 Tax=Flavobacterium sp. TaxID=239 RepID=UPI0012282EF3|nr:alpha/beta hydrolase-fold protein [Flavobacterium sp.]RZJ72940.1 MAG: alpha/beta hydrolase [Flavobacterium sp.]
MKKLLSLFAFCCVATTFAQTETISQKPLTIGEIKTIKSAVLNENRQINIYLPQGYDKDKSYSVVYLLDGSLGEDFLHVVGLVQFFNLMYTMPETIVVGIENVDRKRDFTFHTDLKELTDKYPTTGHSDDFIRFLETELLPYIKSNYKTTNENYLIGQSLGGLLVGEILLRKPQLFSHYLIVSPSLWWDDESLLKNAKVVVSKNDYKGKYVYVSAGGKEDKIMQKDADVFYKIIAATKGVKSDFALLSDEDHGTILHQSLYKAFTKLFKPRY